MTEPRAGRAAPGRVGESDRAEVLTRGARRLSRAGRPVESASAWREAAREYLQTLRPVQGIACVIEAAFLDPHPAGAEAEVRDTARSLRGAPGAPGAGGAYGTDRAHGTHDAYGTDRAHGTHDAYGNDGQRLLAALPADVRADLAARLLPNSCGEDEVFAKEDDQAPSLWLVVRGQVRATRRGTKGARWTVKVVRDGGLLGRWRPLQEGEEAITLVAEASTDLLELRRSDFEEILRQHPGSRRIFDGI